MRQIDPSEINIINYLTGEMTVEESKQFEMQLADNQLLSQQVEEMKGVINHLGSWENKDVQIPVFDHSIINETATANPRNQGKSFKFPNWMKYAAAFLGFALLLQLTGFRVNHNGNTLLLSFGEPSSQSLDATAVDDIVAKAIDKYASDQNMQFADFKNQMNSELVNIANSVDNLSTENRSNIVQIKGIFNKNMDKQYVNLESMIRGIEDNQRQELEDSFTGFVEYIEDKRINDQFQIQNAFSEIATAINNQQNQTNALLTSISDDTPVLKSY